jgi:hypothetical protein
MYTIRKGHPLDPTYCHSNITALQLKEFVDIDVETAVFPLHIGDIVIWYLPNTTPIQGNEAGVSIDNKTSTTQST